MIFAETPRLVLRTLEESDLPRLTELIGDWDVIKWLILPPYPYTLKDAEEFYEKMLVTYHAGKPEYFVVANKIDNRFFGAVGLHPDKCCPSKTDQIEIGYWLGKPYWGQGFVSEAVKVVLALGFKNLNISQITSTTNPANLASQNVLRKSGFEFLGVFPRTEKTLRGSPEMTRWKLIRENYERQKQ